MSLFGKDIETMDNLFVHTLQDIYYAEKQILKALPDMEQKASNPQLKTAFKSHLEETKGHVKRLEQVFKMHGQEPKGVSIVAQRSAPALPTECQGACWFGWFAAP